MIERLVTVGWLGVALLLAAGGSGYLVERENFHLHLVLGLLATGAFLLVYLGLILYAVGTARLVGRTVADHDLEPRWARAYRACWLPTLVASAIALVPLLALFASGFPTYTGAWTSRTHHLFFPLSAVLQVAALLLLRRRVAAGEAQLRALDAELQGSRGG